MFPTIRVMGGHGCRSSVLVQVASTESVRSGGGGDAGVRTRTDTMTCTRCQVSSNVE